MARPDSVLVISQLFNPDFGGLSTRAYCLARLFRSLGCKVTVLTTVPHYPDGYLKLNERFSDDELNLIKLRLKLLPYRGLLNRVINFSRFSIACYETLLNSHDYDLAVSVGFNPFSAIPLRLNSTKYVIDLNDLWPDTIVMKVRNPLLRPVMQSVGRRMNRYIFEGSAGLILLNPNMYKLLRRLYHIREITKWTWIVNPALEELFRPAKDREKIRERLGIDQRSFVIMYHGVFGILQGLPLVITAFGKAISSMGNGRPPVLYLIGHGEERGKILKTINELPLKIREHIKVLPQMSRETVAEYVKAADLGLVPTNGPDSLIYILMPTKSVEYLASGVPILAPKGSFIGNDVVRFRAGFVTDFRDVNETAKLLITAYRILSDEDMWRVYSELAIKLYTDRYSMKVQRGKLLRFLSEL